jgi:hydrogenase-4 membrane subunit HyfE
MLLPKYNLRTALAVMSAFAVFSVVLAEALRGKPWAVGFTIGALSIPLLLVICALFYLACRVIRRGKAGEGRPS